MYFNHRTGKAEKCTLYTSRIESGQPTTRSKTCVGRLRYLGLVLYDADKVLSATTTPDPQDLHAAQLSTFLDPEEPEVRAEDVRQGIPADWIEAARRSPGYALAVKHRVALPIHDLAGGLDRAGAPARHHPHRDPPDGRQPAG